MKKLPLFLFFCVMSITLYSQAPKQISYQAILRDINDNLLVNKQIGLKIVLRQGSTSGPQIFEEFHSTETNKNGLVSLEIGTGNPLFGNFSNLDWSKGPYYIESLVDPDGSDNFLIGSISQFSSVPYALFAESTSSLNGTITESQIENLNHFTSEDIKGNELAFQYWDKNADDDFSGNYEDLQNIPALYTKNEIDNLLASSARGEGTAQSLNLEGSQLRISGGNSVSFENWDTNVIDDFSGNYEDLINKPDMFSGNYNDLKEVPQLYTKQEIDNLLASSITGEGIKQSLTLDGSQLKISGGNSVSFENWDTNASDDFSGNYKDLANTPEVYTKKEVEKIISDLKEEMAEIYYRKAQIIALNGSRSIQVEDLNNTIACITTSTLNITSNFDVMTVGATINLEIHGTTLTIKGDNGVFINGKEGGTSSLGNDQDFTGGLLRKTAANTYIVL